MTFIYIEQGSQTQIHRGATFALKMSLKAVVLKKKDSAGHNMEKNAIYSAKLGHNGTFFCFNEQNF